MLLDREDSFESLSFFYVGLRALEVIVLNTYLTRMGEMALQGPHQVAKQSTRTALSVEETRFLNSSVLSFQSDPQLLGSDVYV